jgi:hypothetical protein
MKRKILCVAVALLLTFTSAILPVSADFAEDILSYEWQQAEVTDMNTWLSESLPEGIGVTAEWYVLALSKENEYDFTAYASALTDYVQKKNYINPVTAQKMALALLASGYISDFVTQTVEDSFGALGVMSEIYSLHLAANGFLPNGETSESLTQRLLNLQLADGGFAVSGEIANPDVTAMAIQALAHRKDDPRVVQAIEKAFACLCGLQTENGSFVAYGIENAESTAQVILALTALGYDANDARFIKNDDTLLDVLARYQCANGGFSHEIGGDVNVNATVQAFLAYASLENGSPYALNNLDRLTYIETETQTEIQTEETNLFPLWRIVALAVIWAVAVIAIVILLIMKKGKPERMGLIVMIGILLSVLIFMIHLEKPSAPIKENPIGKVTLTIRCDVLTDSENRIILPPTEFMLAEGETVFDILTEATGIYKIPMEYNGTPALAYVEGIDGLYERDHGALSGWIYFVNGELPSLSCGSYKLKDGDTVSFHYSLAQGDDIPNP